MHANKEASFENRSEQQLEEKLRPEGWEKPPTLKELKQDFEDAKPSHDAIVQKVQLWLDNLHVRGKARHVPANSNSSSHVPQLIRKQAEWRYAALSEPFLSTQDLFNVAPVTFEDKAGAEQNELVLNYQFNCKIRKTRFIDEYVRTAVDEGTVAVRVGWDFQEEEVTEIVPDIELIEDPAYGEIHNELAVLKVENPAVYEDQVPQELQMAHDESVADGIPYRPEVVGEKEQKLMRTIKNQPTLEVCDYHNFLIDPSARGDMEKAKFVVYSFPSSLADLEKDGRYKNLKHIKVDNSSVLGDPDRPEFEADNFNFKDKPRKQFLVHEYWGFWDTQGDGKLQPFVAAWVGDTLIRLEDNPFPDGGLPFVVVPYLPVRGQVTGEPDGKLLEDNQKVIGAVTRGMIDIMAKSANSQTGTRKDALDPINRRKYERGEDYEFNQGVDPRQGFYMHTFPEIPQSAQYMLGMQNADAESLTGVKAFSSGISGEALGKTAQGVRSALDAASKRELGILRRLADGMTQIGRKVIAMNAVFLEEEEIVRITNDEFVPVRRDDLAGNYDLTLTISTAEEDNAKAEELSFMLQTIGPDEDPGLRKMILSEITKLRKMPALARKIEEYEPQPDPLQQQKVMLELKLLEAQIAEVQSKTVENHAEAQLDTARAGLETARTAQVQSDTDLKNLDFVEQESGVKQERDLEKQGAQARANMEMNREKHTMDVEKTVISETLKAKLKPQTSAK